MSDAPAAGELDGQAAADAGGGEATAGAGETANVNAKPRRGTKTPRKRARRASSGASSTSSAGAPLKGAARQHADKVLEQKLAELLTFPAVPAVMFAPDNATRGYMGEHFAKAGPHTAHELVAASAGNPELRAMLERLTTGSSMFTVALAVAGYAVPPVLWVLGSRRMAAQLTMATTVDEAALEAMMRQAQTEAMEEAAARAAAQAQADQGAEPAESDGTADAEQPPAPAGTDSL